MFDARKPWATQLLCQKSMAELKIALKGLDKYGFPTAGEVENCAYNQADRELRYVQLVAKAIYEILTLKRNLHKLDKEALQAAFDLLRYGPPKAEVYSYDRSHYIRENCEDGLYYDRSKYGKDTTPAKPVTNGKRHSVKFADPPPPIESITVDEMMGGTNGVLSDDECSTSTTLSSAEESELEKLEIAMKYIKDKGFNAGLLVDKMKGKAKNDAHFTHKAKVKLHALLELLEDFDCYDDLVTTIAQQS